MDFLLSKAFILFTFSIVEIISIFKLLESLKQNKNQIPLKKICDLDIGYFGIQGKIVKLGSLLTSPYRGIKCVYYNFKIDKLTRWGKGISWMNNFVNEKRYVDVGIDDGTGIIKIDLGKASVFVGDNFSTISPILKFPNDFQGKLLEKYTPKEKPFSYGFRTRFSETIIKDGTNVYLRVRIEKDNENNLSIADEGYTLYTPEEGKAIETYNQKMTLSILGIIAGILILMMYFLF